MGSDQIILYRIARNIGGNENLAVEPKVTIATVLADFNLTVWYGIMHHMYICKYEILADFNLAVA